MTTPDPATPPPAGPTPPPASPPSGPPPTGTPFDGPGPRGSARTAARTDARRTRPRDHPRRRRCHRARQPIVGPHGRRDAWPLWVSSRVGTLAGSFGIPPRGGLGWRSRARSSPSSGSSSGCRTPTACTRPGLTPGRRRPDGTRSRHARVWHRQGRPEPARTAWDDARRPRAVPGFALFFEGVVGLSGHRIEDLDQGCRTRHRPRRGARGAVALQTAAAPPRRDAAAAAPATRSRAPCSGSRRRA